MNQYLTSAITSIINAKGESIIDNKDEFIRVFTASTKGCESLIPLLESAIDSGAVMIIAQAKNDDNEGQTNAAKIAIDILTADGADKDSSIDVITAFCVAFDYSFGSEKSEKQLIEDAKAHVSKKEYDSAFKILNSLDSPESHYLLGLMYYNGIGTDVAYKKALQHFEKCQTADSLSMQARMYLQGQGCTKNAAEAYKLWNKGADMGDPSCEYYLAMLYLKGIGVTKDMAKAVDYIKSSAKKKFEPAIRALASLPKEYTEKTAAEIDELERLAKEGDVRASYQLGNCYFKGDGVPQNKNKAIDHYFNAASKGHFASQIALITRYTLDDEIPKAWSAAYYWYTKASKSDIKKLSVVHPNLVKGEEIFNSVAKNSRNKRDRYEEAGNLGFIAAYTAIGKMYKGNPEKALPYLTKAADAGDIEAIDILLKKGINSEIYKKKHEYISQILKNCSL